jgi:Spy/CpxP family protein refolding chaperone
MRTTFIPFAFVLVSSAVLAQQPVPGRPITGQTTVAICPIIVVDGKTITPSPNDCVPVPPPGSRVTPPDWSVSAPPPPAADPLARFLFPPELVMGHQEAIGLTDKQRSAIQAAVKEAQAKVVDVQFKMSAEVEKLQHLLQVFTPDEPSVLDEVGRVLTLERDMKLAQMTLMIRIKSELTERQQALLDQMRGGQTPRPAKE